MVLINPVLIGLIILGGIGLWALLSMSGIWRIFEFIGNDVKDELNKEEKE